MSTPEIPRAEVAEAGLDGWEAVISQEAKNSLVMYPSNLELTRRINLDFLLDRENNGPLPDCNRRPTEPFGPRFLYSAELDFGNGPQEALERYELLCALPEGYMLWRRNIPVSLLDQHDFVPGVVVWSEAEEFTEPFKPSDGNVHLLRSEAELKEA